MRKGFTLIELLAVIVILAIITAIATPIVLKVIRNSKNSSIELSAGNYIDSVEKAIVQKNLIKPYNPIKCDITTPKQISCTMANGDVTSLKVKVQGKLPTGGILIIDKGKVTDVNENGETRITYSNRMVEFDSNKKLKISGTTSNSYKCKRAITLHTETCLRTSLGCIIAGYQTGEEIIYGNLGTRGRLTPGDAFDCDLNGNGTYDQRFYYVSPKDSDSNSGYAALIYYSNVVGDNIDNAASSGVQYYADANSNLYGPTTASLNLPKTNQWGNISLTNEIRPILNEEGGAVTKYYYGLYSSVLPDSFDYQDAAARLLTVQEIFRAKGLFASESSLVVDGYLNSHTYLIENTTFSAANSNANGYWLETAGYRDRGTAWNVQGLKANVILNSTSADNQYGVRPVIEIPISELEI